MASRITAVVGARPNYMKVAPIWRELDGHPHIAKTLVHTGQHYDANMSKIFFDDLQLPKPDIYLGVGSAPHGEQTARVMMELERVMMTDAPDLLVVVGDVNSTMAGALAAVKLGVPVAHVESGLRSFDRTMPEEINRMVTDVVADVLFTTTKNAGENLAREGVDPAKIHFVGNVMIDSLNFYRPISEERSTILETLGLAPRGYGLVTLHRPSNVDHPDILRGILGAVEELGAECPMIFPAHPRTRKMLKDNGIEIAGDRIKILDPIGYLDFIKLMVHTSIVLTDSGGIQEETTVLDIPCLTIRNNTERPITVEIGSNRLVGTDPAKIVAEGRKAIAAGLGAGRIPELWDGHASSRIVRAIG